MQEQRIKTMKGSNASFELECTKCGMTYEFEAIVCLPQPDVGIASCFCDDWEGPDHCERCETGFDENIIAEEAVEDFLAYRGPDRKEDLE